MNCLDPEFTGSRYVKTNAICKFRSWPFMALSSGYIASTQALRIIAIRSSKSSRQCSWSGNTSMSSAVDSRLTSANRNADTDWSEFSTPIIESRGNASFSTCKRLPRRSVAKFLALIRLSPGRAILATTPLSIGLATAAKTGNTVVVACFAASEGRKGDQVFSRRSDLQISRIFVRPSLVPAYLA